MHLLFLFPAPPSTQVAQETTKPVAPETLSNRPTYQAPDSIDKVEVEPPVRLSSCPYLTMTTQRRHSQFRPCIDLHGGVVKQIVGGTLDLTASGEGKGPKENFVAT